MKCQRCGKEVFLPFRCPYCGGYFCSEHRLPENHDCPRIELARAPKKETKPIIVQKEKPYEYTVTHMPLEPKRKIHFSNKEIKHLTIAALLVIAIGLSFSMNALGEPGFLVLSSIMLTASFLAHEIAHKLVAQKEGFWAEFRLIFTGAILTLLSIISPFFKIISPGAVMVGGFVDRESMGKISIAGPATNIVLSTIFLATALLLPQNTQIFAFGAIFNAWIALFNLIPFGMLDGFKIFLWNKAIWVLAFTISLILTVVSYIL
jgi:Zn-dependent protease